MGTFRQQPPRNECTYIANVGKDTEQHKVQDKMQEINCSIEKLEKVVASMKEKMGYYLSPSAFAPREARQIMPKESKDGFGNSGCFINLCSQQDRIESLVDELYTIYNGLEC